MATSAVIWPRIPFRLRKPNDIIPQSRSDQSMALRAGYHLDHGREHITTGTHRLDRGGILRVRLDLAADAADQHVDGALERSGAAALRQVEQAVARQHATGPLAERAKQIEFGAGHRDARAFGIA